MGKLDIVWEVYRCRARFLRERAASAAPLGVGECIGIMDGVREMLAGIPETDMASGPLFDVCLLKLSAVAAHTWPRCGCGNVSPLSRFVPDNVYDVQCPNCWEVRRPAPVLPESPWPLYVRALARVRGEDGWFGWLAGWMSASKLAKLDADGTRIACRDGMIIQNDGTVSAAGPVALPMPESAWNPYQSK